MGGGARGDAGRHPAPMPRPPLLLHLLDVLDADSAAAARAKRTGLLPRGALARDNQRLWGEAPTQWSPAPGAPGTPPTHPTGHPGALLPRPRSRGLSIAQESQPSLQIKENRPRDGKGPLEVTQQAWTWDLRKRGQRPEPGGLDSCSGLGWGGRPGPQSSSPPGVTGPTMEGSGEKAGTATQALPHSSSAGGGSSSAGERPPLKFPHTLLWVIPGTRSRPPIPAGFSGAGRQDGGPQGGTEGQEPPGQFTVGTGKGGRGGQGAPCRPGDIGGRAAGCGVFR